MCFRSLYSSRIFFIFEGVSGAALTFVSALACLKGTRSAKSGTYLSRLPTFPQHRPQRTLHLIFGLIFVSHSPVLPTEPFAISLIIITLSFPALIRTCLLPLLHEVDPDVLLPVLEENSIINVIQTSMTSLVIQDLKATAIMKVAIDHILPLELDLDELVH